MLLYPPDRIIIPIFLTSSIKPVFMEGLTSTFIKSFDIVTSKLYFVPLGELYGIELIMTRKYMPKMEQPRVRKTTTGIREDCIITCSV